MQRKKLMLVIFEEGIRPDVMELIARHGLTGYTLWKSIEGAGVTGPKQGNPIWPGLNDVLLLVLDEPAVRPLITALHALRDSLPITPGMRCIIMDAEFV